MRIKRRLEPGCIRAKPSRIRPELLASPENNNRIFTFQRMAQVVAWAVYSTCVLHSSALFDAPPMGLLILQRPTPHESSRARLPTFLIRKKPLSEHHRWTFYARPLPKGFYFLELKQVSVRVLLTAGKARKELEARKKSSCERCSPEPLVSASRLLHTSTDRCADQ